MRRRSWLALLLTPLPALAQKPAASAAPVALSEDHAEAKQLGYRTEAERVDRAAFPQFQKGQRCGNCQLSFAAAEGRVCALFPGHTVSEDGWCKAWVKPLGEA